MDVNVTAGILENADFSFLPTFAFRFLALTILSLMVGGFGHLLLTTLFRNSVSERWDDRFILALTTGLASMVILITGMCVLAMPLNIGYLRAAFWGISGILIAGALLKGRLTGSVVKHAVINREQLFRVLILAGILLGLTYSRVLQIREIIVPNWIDGLIHTTRLHQYIAREAIPLDSIYHTGFHALALFIHALLGLSEADSVLLSGQWLSAVSGLSLYLLCRRCIRNPFYSYMSVILYSHFLFFPSHLISWGRYPFLLGLALLPPAIISAIDWMTGQNRNYLLVLIFVFATALAHYGTLLLWFSFTLAYIIINAWSGKRQKDSLHTERPALIRLIVLIIPLFFLMAPKIVNLAGRQDVLGIMLSRDQNNGFGPDESAALTLALENSYFLTLLWIALVAPSLIWRKSTFWMLVLWSLLALLLTWIQYSLFGLSVTSYTNLIVFLSMPFAISISMILEGLSNSDAMESNSAQPGQLRGATKAQVGALAILLALGTYLSSDTISNETRIFYPADQSAMEWIENNAPQESVFMIRSFLWGEELAPSDAGGWITLLTGRLTVYPEMGEYHDACGYIESNGVNYVYFGKQRDDSNFDIQLSDISGKYSTVFSNEGVDIVRVTCQ
jgi:hypothetical protein